VSTHSHISYFPYEELSKREGKRKTNPCFHDIVSKVTHCQFSSMLFSWIMKSSSHPIGHQTILHRGKSIKNFIDIFLQHHIWFSWSFFTRENLEMIFVS
jgi:hypothetical protein